MITRPEAEQIDLLARDPLERHDQHAIPLPSEEPGDIDDELVDTFATIPRQAPRPHHRPARHHRRRPRPTTARPARSTTQPVPSHRTRRQRPHRRRRRPTPSCDRHRVTHRHPRRDRADRQSTRPAQHRHDHRTRRHRRPGTRRVPVRRRNTAPNAHSPGRKSRSSTHTPTPRSLPDTARIRLAQLNQAADATLTTWTSYLADNGIDPGEADNVQQAIRRVIERATNTLIADLPQWLTTLVGYQPADPIGTQTWTTAVRDIATWRTRHHHTGDDVGIPPVLGDAATLGVGSAQHPARPHQSLARPPRPAHRPMAPPTLTQ